MNINFNILKYIKNIKYNQDKKSSVENES